MELYISALVVLFCTSGLYARRPSYIHCADSRECDADSCCVLGGGRYSIPECMSKRGVGEPCRGNGPIILNTTVGYPDGSTVDLTNVYHVLCDCAQGLVCERATGTCQEPAGLGDNILLTHI